MWDIEFYEKEDGTIPVQKFLDGLPIKHQAKAMREIDILEKYGASLTEPHVKHVEGKLWELRIEVAGDISRIFYFIPVGKGIVLLHGYIKKTRRTPHMEIVIANTYLKDYLRRNKS